MLQSNEFQRLVLKKKILELRKHGYHIAYRYHLRFKVDLYCYNDFLVEVWTTLSFGDIYSIDVAPERSVKESYLGTIDLQKLGLNIEKK